jgi:hypothetical protein
MHLRLDIIPEEIVLAYNLRNIINPDAENPIVPICMWMNSCCSVCVQQCHRQSNEPLPLLPLVSLYQSFVCPFTWKHAQKTHGLSVLFWLEGPAKMSCWFTFAQSYIYMNSLIT